MLNPNSRLLLKSLQTFALIDSEFSLQAAICFLIIASNEGINGKELSKRTGIPFSTISRCLASLSDRPRYKKDSYYLVELKVDQSDRRNKTAWLTAKGKRLLSQIDDK